MAFVLCLPCGEVMKRSVVNAILVVNLALVSGGIALWHTNKVRREAEEKKAMAMSEKFIGGAIELGSTFTKQELTQGELLRFRLIRDNTLSPTEFASLMNLIERDLADTSQGVSFISLISGFRVKPKLNDAQRKQIGTVCARVAKGGYPSRHRTTALAMIKINRLTEFYPELQSLRHDSDKRVAKAAERIFSGDSTAKVVRE